MFQHFRAVLQRFRVFLMGGKAFAFELWALLNAR